jgi:hypothetical protein
MIVEYSSDTQNYYIHRKDSDLYFSGFDAHGSPVFGPSSNSKPYGSEDEAVAQAMLLMHPCDSATVTIPREVYDKIAEFFTGDDDVDEDAIKQFMECGKC